MTDPRFKPSRGPFRVDHLTPGDPYELSDGHPILCSPAGPRHASANALGAEVLSSDPLVESAGVDLGFSPEPGTLRAPDVSVGGGDQGHGFAKGAPALAVEYADVGQNEAALASKIADLLAAGTRFVWVARLVGPRRVEVHEPGVPMVVVMEGGELAAPGVLQNVVPVRALYERDAAHEATLRNLLGRKGYASLDAVRAAGHAAGLRAAILLVLQGRGIDVDAALRARIDACDDAATLGDWLQRAAVASSVSELDPPG